MLLSPIRRGDWEMSRAWKFSSGRCDLVGSGVKKAPNEFIGDGGIFGGAKTFTDTTLGANTYEGEIRDISISPRRSNQKGEPLDGENSHYALRWGINADCSNCETWRIA